MSADASLVGLSTPNAVRRIGAHGSIRSIWVNAAGGVTFEVRQRASCFFVKWAPSGACVDLGAERERLAWAASYTSVPDVIDHGEDDEGSWIVTAALSGESGVSDRWRRDPARAVRAIGAGLRGLHEALPLEACPFVHSAETRTAQLFRDAAAHPPEPSRWHAEHRGLEVHAVLRRLADIPPVDRLVVCHGDACAPNTIIDIDGRCAGHVDLGRLGTADRWSDLAIATWSAEWNYGPGWEGMLLDAYGSEPDPERTSYYRLLWDLAE